MTDSQIEHIGPFAVHDSIINGILGWKPNYWSVLTLETREKIKTETLTRFKENLSEYSSDSISKNDPAYLNWLLIKFAGKACASFWHQCIYEHQKRQNKIQEGNVKQCGARKKNGQQCKANAIYGSGRCRHHGGKSTGPKTIEGKIKSLSHLMQYRRNPELLIDKKRQLEAEMEMETGF